MEDMRSTTDLCFLCGSCGLLFPVAVFTVKKRAGEKSFSSCGLFVSRYFREQRTTVTLRGLTLSQRGPPVFSEEDYSPCSLSLQPAEVL